jgi:hypothetical protein
MTKEGYTLSRDPEEYWQCACEQAFVKHRMVFQCKRCHTYQEGRPSPSQDAIHVAVARDEAYLNQKGAGTAELMAVLALN